MSALLLAHDDIDKHVDDEIAACLNLAAPRSFFLFAGAGSGKTRSLVKALQHVQRTSSAQLKVKGQRVGVITFTNAASDEIKSRLLFDPLIDVRTIHSFAWSLIQGLNRDIREALRSSLRQSIDELIELEKRGRKGTKASVERLRRIESRTRRLENLDRIKRFVYSPTGDNRERDALNHYEVLQVTARFLRERSAMQSILAGRYPILLIDESQDTNKDLLDALFAVQVAQPTRFTLGLLGDMMQRIYNEGKEGLGEEIPAEWATPKKRLNFRCPRRVVTLINRVRSTGDGQEQEPCSAAPEGVVRLFILPNDTDDKSAAEGAIARLMANVTGDPGWGDPNSVKTLTVEHRMAAERMGFLDIFNPLYDEQGWRTSFLEGELPAARFFSRDVLALVAAKQSNDKFGVARIARELSPLLSAVALRAATDKQRQLQIANNAIDDLMMLWANGGDPSLMQVLRKIAETGLLAIPESLQIHASGDLDRLPRDSDSEEDEDGRLRAIEVFLAAPFSQVRPFAEYLGGRARFDTHQGVKGLEFERVMVVMDDAAARGFNFKYEDLFGGKPAGEKTVENTRRLFYVTCSRAEKSLALVAYSSGPERIRDYVLREGWFRDEEVLLGVPDSAGARMREVARN